MSDFIGNIVDEVKGLFKDNDKESTENIASNMKDLMANPFDANLQSKLVAEVNQLQQEAATPTFEFYDRMNLEFAKLEEQGFPSISVRGNGEITAMPSRDPATRAPEGSLRIQAGDGEVHASLVDNHSPEAKFGWKHLY